MAIKNDLEESIEKLREQRDELRLKMHLASMEVQDEWDELEKVWEELLDKTRHLKKELDPTLEDIHYSFLLLADELKEAYRKLKNGL